MSDEINLPADEHARLLDIEQQLLATSPAYQAEVASRTLAAAPFLDDAARGAAAELVAARIAKGEAPAAAVSDFLASRGAAHLLRPEGRPAAAPPTAPAAPRTIRDALAAMSPAAAAAYQGSPGIGLDVPGARTLEQPPVGADPLGILGPAEQRAMGQYNSIGLHPRRD